MEEILDLDKIIPESKKVKLNGKTLTVYPPTIRQLLKIQRVGQDIQARIIIGLEAETKLIEALSSVIPALKEDDGSIDFNQAQLIALVQFVQSTAIPQDATVVGVVVKKKMDSSEQ